MTRVDFRVAAAQRERAARFQAGRQDGGVQGFGQAVDGDAAAGFRRDGECVGGGGVQGGRRVGDGRQQARRQVSVLQPFQVQVFGQRDEAALLALQDTGLNER